MSALRVLIIDDSEVLLSRMRRALVAEGYEVTTTSQTTGNARHIPTHDLVIIFFHMPGIDGSEVMESLRKAARSREHTCLYYLYTSDKTLELDYERYGFNGVITNKGDDSALVRQVGAIARILQLRSMTRR